jgi:uncharacterized protein
MAGHQPADTSEGLALLREHVRGDMARLQEILDRQRVLLLVLYGSTAKGRDRGSSDLDVAALLEGPEPDLGWMSAEIDLESDLDDLLRPSRELNVFALNRAPELLQVEVVQHGKILYEREPGSWVWYRIKARRRYEDTEKYRERRWQSVLRRNIALIADQRAHSATEDVGAELPN